MELKDIIRDYKYKYNLTNNEIAERFKLNSNTVARWLRGEVKALREETAYNISQVLGFDIQPLLDGKAVSLKRPILGCVKAGYDMFVDSNFIGEEFVSIDEYKQGDYFLKVSGDSMVDSGIIDGSLVYIQQCSSVRNGEIAVVLFNDEVTIKRFYKTDDGIDLVADNKNVENRHFSFEEAEACNMKIIGRVLFSKNYV